MKQLHSFPLTEDILKNSSDTFLIDTVKADEILVISFGFVSWDSMPNFDFWGRLKKIEGLTGLHINKLLIRDLNNDWYHGAMGGLGAHVDEVAGSIKKIILEVPPCVRIVVAPLNSY